MAKKVWLIGWENILFLRKNLSCPLLILMVQNFEAWHHTQTTHLIVLTPCCMDGVSVVQSIRRGVAFHQFLLNFRFGKWYRILSFLKHVNGFWKSNQKMCKLMAKVECIFCWFFLWISHIGDDVMMDDVMIAMWHADQQIRIIWLCTRKTKGTV